MIVVHLMYNYHYSCDSMCGHHPNVPWCCVIVVHCECFDHFPRINTSILKFKIGEPNNLELI
jgi:hypothetical protein